MHSHFLHTPSSIQVVLHSMDGYDKLDSII